MSLVWPNKDPDELLDYSVDWTAALGTLSITNVAWSVRSTRYSTEVPLASGTTMTFGSGGAHVDGIQNISQSTVGKVAVIFIAGGTDKVDYTFVCTITTSQGTILQRSVILRCRSV
jgi:hypothetical protein